MTDWNRCNSAGALRFLRREADPAPGFHLLLQPAERLADPIVYFGIAEGAARTLRKAPAPKECADPGLPPLLLMEFLQLA